MQLHFTTFLGFDKYDIAKTPLPKYQPSGLNRFIVETQKEASLGYDYHEFLIGDDVLVTSTFGKYKVDGISMTQAMLEEHEAERQQEKS